MIEKGTSTHHVRIHAIENRHVVPIKQLGNGSPSDFTADLSAARDEIAKVACICCVRVLGGGGFLGGLVVRHC